MKVNMEPATKTDKIENGVQKTLETTSMQKFTYQIWKISIIFMKIIYSIFCMNFRSYLESLQIPSYFSDALKEDAREYINYQINN